MGALQGKGVVPDKLAFMRNLPQVIGMSVYNIGTTGVQFVDEHQARISRLLKITGFL
jgi:hypothetical protein